MTNRATLLLLFGAILFSLGLAAPAPAAPARHAYMPVVGGSALPPINPDPVKVLDCSCGDATVELRPDGRLYIMVQDFDRGGRLYLYEDNLTTFKPAADVPLITARTAPAPSFDVPGQKHGPGGMAFLADRLVIYAPARPEGVFEGDYDLYRYEVSLLSLP